MADHDAATTIVCLGDSITGSEDLAAFVKWPRLVELMAEARCGAGRVRVINAGIGGDTTSGMLARLDADVLAQRPDIVVLLAGGNDAGRGVDRAVTARNLAEIVARIAAGASRLMGLSYHLVEHPGAEAAAWRHLPTNNDLLAAAVRARGGALVDTAAAMAAARRAQPAGELVAADAVHLAPGGELVYARAVFAALDGRGWLTGGLERSAGAGRDISPR